ncbi:hypothetical protein [Azorhizophilus paspali]|uniref:Uncharacterized protein n=1 Tax=Azorhizophilus paspali TaxID=69963 RepID=A0ABV6SI81_AZOPA
MSADDSVEAARIVPPTAQNQPSIEADLEAVATSLLDQPEEVIRRRCELSINNHDPCISYAIHFLKLSVHRACMPG